MRRRDILAALCAALLWTVLSGAALAEGPKLVSGSGAVAAGAEGGVLSPGGKVRTGPGGKARLELRQSGLRVDMAQDSEAEYKGPDAKGAQTFRVTKGKVRFTVLPGNGLEVQTPHLVASVRGTAFEAQVDPRMSIVTVLRGLVSVRDSKNAQVTVARSWSVAGTAEGFTPATKANLGRVGSPPPGPEPAEEVIKFEDNGGSDGGTPTTGTPAARAPGTGRTGSASSTTGTTGAAVSPAGATGSVNSSGLGLGRFGLGDGSAGDGGNAGSGGRGNASGGRGGGRK